MSSDDPSTRDFWQTRYLEGTTGWDLGQPAPPFVDLMAAPDAPLPDSMIVLGCGRGHDAIFFAKKGFSVTAVDFAPAAIEAARRLAEQAGVDISFVEADLFALDEAYSHGFTYVLEHTCFAAIPPTRREEYVQVVNWLLAPGGTYIALFYAHGKPGGPPFDTTAAEVRALFEPRFLIERLEPPARSTEQRQGQELFAVMHPLAGESRP